MRTLLVDNFTGWARAIEQCFDDVADRLTEHVDRRGLSMFVLTTMERAVMLARTYKSLDAYDTAVTPLRDCVDRILADGADWTAPKQLEKLVKISKPNRK